MGTAFVVAILFGCAGYLASELAAWRCRTIMPFADGPPPGRPPTVALIAGAVIVGFGLALRISSLPLLALSMLVVAGLVACWYCDVRTGILPDIFTLVPLGAVVATALLSREPFVLVQILVVALPFAVLAIVSKGRGMGWGDVKLAALGGGLLGMQLAIAAFAGACVVAVIVAFARGRKTEPIAFAPYLSGAIGVAMLFGLY